MPTHLGGLRVKTFAKKIKMEEGGGAAAVVGGNSARALRLAKRNRYGKDTYKMRIPTHYRYCLRLLTYTTEQQAFAGSGVYPATPTTNTVEKPGFNVLPEGGQQLYHELNPRDQVGQNGEMSLNACGLYWWWGEELPTPSCPWLTTYFGYKLDQTGFNICDPQQFSDNCERFQYVKQGPACATFVLPDVPIEKAGPVRRYYPLTPATYTEQTGGTLSTYGRANIEERGIGAWEMIVIPPRKMQSINVGVCLNQNGWDHLIDMGFKPRPVTRVTKIYCSNGGLDHEYLLNALNQADLVATRPYNPVNNPAGQPFPKSLSITNLKYRKMSYVDTELVCQYTDVDPTADLMNQQINNYDWAMKQGYPCVPFGSAVIFRFRQFAPVQATIDTGGQTTYAQTAVRQTIPMDLYLDSVTTFKAPVLGDFDLDLPYSDPIRQPQ